MNLETYLKNRLLFESRYQPNELGTCYLNEMNNGMRNFDLFIALYGHDRRMHLRSNTYGVDRRKRYSVPFKKMIGTKIHISDLNYSLFDRWPDSFEKLQNQLTTNTK